MSILQLDLPEARVLDLYSGSGALGLEALSRGAVSADFVERDPKSLRALEENIEALGAGPLATIHRKSALSFANALGAVEYDVVFADPPYASGDAERIAANVAMPAGGATRKYGSTAITFYRSEG
jgi:16S rRNA (guanine966-N2)-methyltransferase